MSTTNSILPVSDRGKDLIKRYLLGGIKLGAGGALATSLINYLSVLNKKNTSEDDDTLYVYKDVPKEEQEKKAGIEGGIAMAALPLGAVGAYALIRKLYTELRKRQAQEVLDDSQKGFVETQGFKTATKGDTQEKEASARKPMSMLENLTSAPFAIPLLLALGAGIVSKKTLDQHFPVTKPKVKGPRRIEIIDPPDEGQEIDKEAAAHEFHDYDACEFLVRMVGSEKRAHSDLANVVASVATQGATPFLNAVNTAGYEAALDMVKGASANYVHPFKEHIATCFLAKSARLRDLIGITAAAEFAEMHPGIMKAAAALSDEKQDALYKIACIFGRAFRSEITEEFGIIPPADTSLTKYAMSDDLFAELADRVANRVDNDDSSDTSGEEAGIGDPNSPSRQKRKVKFILNGTSARKVMDGMPSTDIIDKMLSPEAGDA